MEYRKEPVSITSMGGLRRFCGLQFEDSMQFYIRALLRKHTDWEYEDEFRMFLPLEEFDERVMHNPSVHLLHIPTEALREIILGARMSEDDANVIRKIVSEDPRWGHVRLFHAELNEQDMPLNYLEDKGITGH